MKTARRRKDLLTMIQDKGELTLTEIAEHFGVSKMTIHRDLDVLESHGLIRRIFGGAVPTDDASSALPAAAISPSPARTTHPVQPKDSCLVCLRPVTQHLLYGLTLSTGEQCFACCPHCGLSAHLRHKENIVSAMTADFVSGRPHPAHRSYYLMGSAAAPCCIPSILSFENEDQAKRFQVGFGGCIGSLLDALTYLQDEMTMGGEQNGCPHCAAAHG